MKLKKRKKSTRYRGSQTHRRGHRKRTRGLGNKGGVGMSGSENQKKSLIMNLYGPEYFGGDRAIRRKVAPKLKVINLNDLIERFDSLVKQGTAKQTKSGFEFNLPGYKVLSGTGLNAKISLKASAASKSAIEQVKAAGGSIELKKNKEAKKLEEKKEENKAEVKEEKKSEPAKKK
jgi:large subunit ribosomal protein L15